MTDEGKTREQLLEELEAARQRNAELESSRKTSLNESGEIEVSTKEQLASFLVESDPDYIWSSDLDGKITYVNRAGEGWTVEEVVGKSILDFQSTEEARTLTKQALEYVISTGESTEFSHDAVVDVSGTVRSFTTKTSPMLSPSGEIQGCLFRATDVTQRKKAEERLEVAHALLQSSVEALPDMVVLCLDTDYRYLYFNKAHVRVMQYAYGTQENIREGANLLDCITDGNDRSHAKELYDRALSGEAHSKTAEWGEDKQRRYFETIYSPITNNKGEVIGATAFARDITERKQAEETLRRSEARFRTLVETMHAAVVVHGSDGVIAMHNPAAQRLLGAGDTPILGRPGTDSTWRFLDEDGTELAPDRLPMARVLASGKSVRDTVLGVIPPGADEITWLLTNAAPLRDLDGGPSQVVITSSDITERKRAEVAAAESLQLSEDLFKASFSGIYVYEYQEPDRLILIDANEAAERMTGVKLCDWKGKEFNEVWPEARKSGYTDIYLQVVRSRLPFEGEDLRYEDERVNVAIRAKIFPLPKNRVAVVFDDILEQKRAQETQARLEGQLRQAQKMESLGQLAGGVAHDINNMLTGITGIGSLMLAGLDQQAPQYADVRSILNACKRGHDLTRNLLGFAREGKYTPRRVSINQIVDDTEQLLKRTISKGIVIRKQLASDPLYVHADAGQISHALLNICLNAADAMGEKGTLTVSVEGVTVPAGKVDTDPDRQAGSWVRLSVKDTGHGMDAETKERMFEPFFTTKPQGMGTGLGLSMVYGTIKNHGGDVVIDSEPGQGTTVTIQLPIATAVGPGDEVAVAREQPVRRGGVVLLVDDEKTVRVTGKRVLDRLGYETIVAENGEAALELYRQRGSEISFVILDLAMPVLDGAETFQKLGEIDADIKVFMCSGYFLDERVESLLERGAIGFIQKPYTLDSLAAVIDKALGPPS